MAFYRGSANAPNIFSDFVLRCTGTDWDFILPSGVLVQTGTLFCRQVYWYRLGFYFALRCTGTDWDFIFSKL